MNNTTKFGLCLGLIVCLSACDSSEQTAPQATSENNTATVDVKNTPPTPDNRSADEILANAIHLQDEATELGHAWRPTANFIVSAQELLTQGDADEARATALRAELSAAASIDQANTEQTAWLGRFPD